MTNPVQHTITSTEWTQISTAGESITVCLDDDNEQSGDRADVRIWRSATIPSTEGNPANDTILTKARRVTRARDNGDALSLSATFGNIFWARCKNAGDTAIISVDTGIGTAIVSPAGQLSYSKDATLTTDYERDYITRGMAFEVQRRITLTSQQTLYLEFNIALAVGKLVYSLPLKMQSNGGNVFLDTYHAASSTGGTVLMTPNNLNALSANVALTTVKTGVTPTGTISGLREYSIGSKITNQAAGGGTGQGGSAKLLDNTKPLYFKFGNQESTTVVLDFGFIWYEIPA